MSKWNIQMHLYNSNWFNQEIETWFKESWSVLGFFILQCLTLWAREGQVEKMKENFLYFCIDICVKMFELANKDGLECPCSNISFRFESYIEKKMTIIFKHHLLNAIRNKKILKK